jgi:hypothetical protein
MEGGAMVATGTARRKKGGHELTVGQLDPARIREQWADATGTPPPRYISRTLLMRMLADRIQVAEYGGISAEMKRRLLRIAGAIGRGDPIADMPARKLKPGTILVREWQGARHQVMVLEAGFTLDGQTYGSLSEVARHITGTRWSGPAFFGLNARRKPKGSARVRP